MKFLIKYKDPGVSNILKPHNMAICLTSRKSYFLLQHLGNSA